MHPQPRVRNETKHTSIVTTVTPERPGIPRAMVLRLTSRSPRRSGLLSPSSARLLADLTPASGRQNHTTSPSASAPFVTCAARVHRIPPRVDDVAQRPSVGRDQIAIVLILPRRQAKLRKFRNRPEVMIGPDGPSPPALSAPWHMAHACSRATDSNFEQPAMHSHSASSFLNVLLPFRQQTCLERAAGVMEAAKRFRRRPTSNYQSCGPPFCPIRPSTPSAPTLNCATRPHRLGS
jgi:hypothetical protein